MGQFGLVYGCLEERQEKMFLLTAKSCKIYLYKNAKVLVTGRKFIVNIKPQDIYVLLCLILKMFFHTFMQILELGEVQFA